MNSIEGALISGFNCKMLWRSENVVMSTFLPIVINYKKVTENEKALETH